MDAKNKQLKDEQRFEKFLEILPEQKVYDFLGELSNAQYISAYNRMLEDYHRYSETVFSNFDNQKIQNSFQKFNKIFESLFSFLLVHFFAHNNFPIDHGYLAALYPEMRHSPDEEKSRLWDKRFKELRSLCKNFYKKYRNFLTIIYSEFSSKEAKELNEKKDEITKLFPEFYGIGINLKALWKKVKNISKRK